MINRIRNSNNKVLCSFYVLILQMWTITISVQSIYYVLQFKVTGFGPKNPRPQSTSKLWLLPSQRCFFLSPGWLIMFVTLINYTPLLLGLDNQYWESSSRFWLEMINWFASRKKINMVLETIWIKLRVLFEMFALEC